MSGGAKQNKTKQIMRKIFILLAMVALVVTGCEKNPVDDGKQIQLPNETEKNQQAFADDESTGGFTFTAKADWTANVTETTARTSSMPWLRLLHNGVETYNGAAGSFTLTVEMDTNYSGETRSATITITSGGDNISVTVTQAGKTAQGEAPEIPRLITGIKESATFNSDYYSNDDYQPRSFEFKYDEKEYRLKELRIKNPSYEERGNYVYTYDYSILNEIRVSDNHGEKLVGKLNDRGFISNIEFPEDEYSEPTTLTYSNDGYLQRVTQGDDYIAYTWKNGNISRIQGNYGEGTDLLYTTELNNKTTIDLNIFFMIEGGVQSDLPDVLFGLIDKTGKRSNNYMIFGGVDEDKVLRENRLYTAETEPKKGAISTWHTREQDGAPFYSFDAEGYPIAYTWKIAVTKNEIIYAGVREYVEPRDENEAQSWEWMYGAGPWFNLVTTEKSYPAVIDTYKYTISYNR